MLVCRPAHPEDGPLLAGAPAFFDAAVDLATALRSVGRSDDAWPHIEAFRRAMDFALDQYEINNSCRTAR